MNQTILHVINDVAVGGAQTLLESLVGASTDECHLVVLKGEDELSARMESVFKTVTHLGVTRHPVKGLMQARKLVRRLRPDVVHSHLFQSDLLNLYLLAGSHIRASTIHTTALGKGVPRMSRFIARLVAMRSRKFDILIATDESCSALIEEFGFRSPDVTIRNGTKIPQAPSTYRPTSTKVCMLARAHPVKGHGTAFRGFEIFHANFPRWQLECWGRGVSPHHDLMIESLRAVGGQPEWLTLRGESASIDEALDGAAALLIASEYGETFPLVGTEACARGIPVIGAEVGGVPDFVLDSRLVWPAGDTQGMADALRIFAGMSTGERIALSRASRDLAVAQFGIESVAARYEAMYSQAALLHRRMNR